MSARTWLRSRLALLAGCACGLAALLGMLVLVGTDAHTALLVALVAGAPVATGLVVDAARGHAFWHDVARMGAHPGDALALAEALERPAGAQEQLVFDALVAVADASNAENARLRARANEHRDFVETWVHEVKTPLAAVELLVENAGDAALAPVREELDRVDACVERALFYARADSVDRDYLVRSCSVEELVRQAVRSRARMLIGARVGVRMEGLGLAVFADPKWMAFVLGQLVDNAVKYRRTDGAEPACISFTAEVADAGQADERVLLHVHDNGVGIPPRDVDRIFDRGFTGENGRLHGRSSGMGLYLVRELCGKMGLSVQAQDEGGATITIAFPTNRMHLM